MIAGLIAILAGSAGKWIVCCALGLLTLGCTFMGGHVIGVSRTKAAADERRAAAAEAAAAAEHRAWQAETAVPEDPDAVLHKHEL